MQTSIIQTVFPPMTRVEEVQSENTREIDDYSVGDLSIDEATKGEDQGSNDKENSNVQCGTCGKLFQSQLWLDACLKSATCKPALMN